MKKCNQVFILLNSLKVCVKSVSFNLRRLADTARWMVGCSFGALGTCVAVSAVNAELLRGESSGQTAAAVTQLSFTTSEQRYTTECSLAWWGFKRRRFTDRDGLGTWQLYNRDKMTESMHTLFPRKVCAQKWRFSTLFFTHFSYKKYVQNWRQRWISNNEAPVPLKSPFYRVLAL